MSGIHCDVLALPEDTLLFLFESWLELKGVVRFDSAICKHSLRPSYLAILGKCPLLCSQYSLYLADEYIRWRAFRHLKRLDTLFVGQVSESFVRNSTHAADVLEEIKNLFIYHPEGDNTTRWLKLVAPLLQNLSEFVGIGLRFADIDWIPLLGSNENLQTLSMHFEYKVNLQSDSMLYHFRNYHALKFVRLSNYCCNGIESILSNNTNLIKLMLDNCNSMTDETFTLILNLPYVQHIDLCGNIVAAGDGALNITTITLRMLRLTHFHLLTEDSLLRILTTLPNKPLVNGEFVRMKRITAAFADRCKHLCLNNVHIVLQR